MFSFLTKSDKLLYVDKVWQTKQACLKGITVEAINASKNSRIPVVFFFFEESRQKFIQFLDSNRLAYKSIEPGMSSDESLASATIFIMNAFASESHEMADWLSRRSNVSPLLFLFLGHYPLVGPEDRVMEKLRQRIPVPVVFCLSLEDMLFQNFGSDRINTLMESLGLGKDECIEHNLVSKAILRARKKLDDTVKNERKTLTEADWFTQNIKQQI